MRTRRLGYSATKKRKAARKLHGAALLGRFQPVFFELTVKVGLVLVGHRDAQLANGGESWTHGFLGHGSTIRQYISSRVKRQLPIWVTADPGAVSSLGDC